MEFTYFIRSEDYNNAINAECREHMYNGKVIITEFMIIYYLSIYLYTYKTLIILLVCLFVCLFVCLLVTVHTINLTYSKI